MALREPYGAMVGVYDELRQGKEKLGLDREIQIALPTRREAAGWLQTPAIAGDVHDHPPYDPGGEVVPEPESIPAALRMRWCQLTAVSHVPGSL